MENLRLRHIALADSLLTVTRREVVGGLIGGISTENDNGTAFSPIGALIGAIVGTLLSYLIEEITSEYLELTGMNPAEKREAIRRVVPQWTGRVVVLD